MFRAGHARGVSATDDGVFDRLPEPYARGYLVVAFFVLPAVAVILSGGGVQRPPGPLPTALLALIVVHHAAFLVVSVLFD